MEALKRLAFNHESSYFGWRAGYTYRRGISPKAKADDRNMSLIKKIRLILKPKEFSHYLVLIGLALIGAFVEMLGVAILFPVMVIVSQSDIGSQYPIVQPLLDYLGRPSHSEMISGAMFALVGIYLFKNSYLAFLAWRKVRGISEIQTQLSKRIFAAYLRQPYTFHLQRNSAKLGHNISEVNIFMGALTSVQDLMADGLVLLGITVILLLAEPMGVLIVISILATAIWSFNHFTRSRITRWGIARQFHNAQRNKHMYQGFGGVKDVKLLGREQNFLTQYQFHNAIGIRVTGSQTILQMLPRLWLELLAVVALAILVLSMLGQGSSAEMIVPTLALFAGAAFRLMPAVVRMLSGVQNLRFNLPSVNLLYEEVKLIFSEPNNDSESNVTPIEFNKDIRLMNIKYSYPNAQNPSLSDVSIKIQKGESIGFIGPSGSGKSTLIDIILGLLPPNLGKMEVDGYDIQENLRSWQNQIGYVPQSIYLTDDTLKRNVAFGLLNEEIDEVAIQSAIKDAQLEEFVGNLPKGLETVVGERGVRISGGQRQRIGIARALYHNPGVLVLDEATSALDTDTEEGVMQAITALKGSKTILIVAHRLSTVEHCDRLFRLENGKVMAEGLPEEIILVNQSSITPN
jgi:ABC-type multidrug transport system fused ATPase/permease subunit